MNIIIAEDEVIIAESFVLVLEALGHKVIAIAYSGEEAVKKTLELKPDIVFVDIAMEYKTSGIDACKRIKESDCRSQVVFLSAYNEDLFFEELQKVNYDGFVDKVNFERDVRKYLNKIKM